MDKNNTGTSLVEVLVALVLVSATASWGLRAAAATERVAGAANARRSAMHRAALALADLQALPCDTIHATRTAHESRWAVVATRVTVGPDRHDVVVLSTRRGDTITIGRHRWCSR